MNKILGFSGKKNSGKNTAANFLIGINMYSLGLTSAFKINSKGELWINDLRENKDARGILDINSNDPNVVAFRQIELDPYIRIYSFADALKQKICMDILGLTYEQCYGKNDDKNSLTHLKWENMPGVVTPDFIDKYDNLALDWGLVSHEFGIMTAREVLQFVGTEIFRKMYGDVWVDTCLRQIKTDYSDFSIITDIRFPNEVEGIQKAGGKVIRFTRAPFEDTHTSEIALDRYEGFDFVLDNKNMSIGEQNKSLYRILHPIGWITRIEEEQ